VCGDKQESEKPMTTSLPAKHTNAFIEAAEESKGRLGPMLKFIKGRYSIGDDEVATDREYVAHMGGVMKAWVRFDGGKVVDQRIGKVSDGFKWGDREELGDSDENGWERDGSGKPRDPWSKQYYLPLEDLETGDLVVFVTGSEGGRGAVNTTESERRRGS
jgi:hypothetical protein